VTSLSAWRSRQRLCASCLVSALSRLLPTSKPIKLSFNSSGSRTVAAARDYRGLAEARAEHEDPEKPLPRPFRSCCAADLAHTTDLRSRGRSGVAIAARKRALSEWDKENSSVAYDPEWFRRDVWPGLADVPLKTIVEAIGRFRSWSQGLKSRPLEV